MLMVIALDAENDSDLVTACRGWTCLRGCLYRLLFSCFVISSIGAAPSRASEWGSAQTSLYIAARSFSLGPPSFSTFVEESGGSSESGVTGAEFVEMATKLGMTVKPVRCSAVELTLVSAPVVCVLFLDDARFAVATEVAGDVATVFDPSMGTAENIDLSKRWGGQAFFLSDRPIVFPSGYNSRYWWVMVSVGMSLVLGTGYWLSLRSKVKT